MAPPFRVSDLAGIQVRPVRLWTHSLSWILFVAGIALYAHFSIVRHRENPEDRVIPSATQMIQGLKTSVLEPAEEDDPLAPGASLFQQVRHSMIWKDTASSARRASSRSFGMMPISDTFLIGPPSMRITRVTRCGYFWA